MPNDLHFTSVSRLLLGLLVVGVFGPLTTASRCPNGLECSGECCVTENGAAYCCSNAGGGQTDNFDRKDVLLINPTRTWGISLGLLIAGLVVSLIISVVASILCCLYCNRCGFQRFWSDGNSVVGGGFGLPSGTVVISSHPAYIQGQQQSIPMSDYAGSTISSVASTRDTAVKSVRFNEDGTPITPGILKNRP